MYEIIQTGDITFAVGEVSVDPNVGSKYVTVKDLTLEKATALYARLMGYKELQKRLDNALKMISNKEDEVIRANASANFWGSEYNRVFNECEKLKETNQNNLELAKVIIEKYQQKEAELKKEIEDLKDMI